MSISRRSLLKILGTCVAGGIFVNGVSARNVFGAEEAMSKVHRNALPAPVNSRVVILVGGYAGLYCAKVPYTKSAFTASLQGKSVAHRTRAYKNITWPPP